MLDESSKLKSQTIDHARRKFGDLRKHRGYGKPHLTMNGNSKVLAMDDFT